MNEGIRTVQVEKDEAGVIHSVRLVFGPHYFVELHTSQGKVEFMLGATHHGFVADASEIDGALEGIIYEIRRSHPDRVID